MQVKQSRLLYRTIHSPLDKLYSDPELEQLENLFLQQMGNKQYADLDDFKAILKQLQVEITESDLSSLLESYFTYQNMPDTSLHKKVNGQASVNLQKILTSMDDATLWNFTTFAKILAIIVDQEGRTRAHQVN